MRINCFVIYLLGIFFNSLVSLANPKDTCAVLTGTPLNPDSYQTVKFILEKQLNCFVKDISLETDEIATADLTNIKFLYWAGGPYFKFNPSEAAAKNIRKAVANGMGYFGTCGGSLIAVDSTRNPRANQLSLFPGYQPYGNGRSMRDYELNLEHPVIVNSSVADSFKMRESIHYSGGGSDFCPSVPGLVNWVIGKDVLRNTPALTCTMYGKGRVFLSVAHPERSYLPATWKFVLLAAEWCLGRNNPLENKAPVVQTSFPQTGKVNQELVFSAVGSDDPEGYPLGFIWNFNDGTELSFKPEEKHVFSRKGDYNVTLRITDGVNEISCSQIITIEN